MDTRFLESLLAVVERGSIVGAARAQGLTAAAVSQRIQVLEQDIGAPLLLRRANAAQPTPLCLDLLADMRAMVALRQRLRGSADPASATGVVRLGAISTLLTGLVPQMLPALRRAAPGLSLRVEPGSSVQLYDALCDGRLDAALIVAPPFAAAASLALHPLRAEPLCLLTPAAYDGLPLAEVFRQLPLIAYDPQSWGGQLAEQYLRDHGLAPERFCTLDGLEAISDLVASGIGASLVPRWPGLRGGRALPGGDAYLRRIVLAAPVAPARPAAHAALLASLGLPS